MTTNTKLCTECSRPITARTSAHTVLGAIGYHDVCSTCYEVWGWENTHADDSHDDLPADAPERADCLVCHPPAERKAKKASVPTGRTNTSHAACAHPKTPAARAKCRKARAKA